MKGSITIKDVAKHANVSIATVSRVINDSPLVSADAKEKVITAIKELGYEPNALARGLVSRKSNTIGVLIPDVSNLFFAEVFRGMEDAVHKHNSNVFICNTELNKEKMLRYIKFLREKQVEGVIFTSEEVTEDYYLALKSLNVPVVLVATESQHDNKLPAVKVNDVVAVKDAINYLISKGHKEIGMISGPLDDKIAGLPRFKGYKEALIENGIPFKEDNVAFGDFRFNSGRDAIKELLNRNPEITAVFASSDEMAIGSLVEASKMGLKLPDELSIIGFDNVRISEMSNPALTTVDQDLFNMGKKGVEILFDLIERHSVVDEQVELNKTFYIEHKIIERESVVTFL